MHAESLSPDTLVKLLLNTFEQNSLHAFKAFLAKHQSVRKWMIVSDFVIGDPKAFHDTYVYTIFPANAPIEQLLVDLSKLAPRDLKNTRSVSAEFREYVRSGAVFSICLLTPKGYRVAGSLDDVRASVDRTIQSMQSWNDARTQSDIIDAFRALRQRAKANNFKAALISTMVVSTTLAAFTALLLTREHQVELVGWLPDRDNITHAYDSVAHLMFSVNFSAFCQQRGIRHDDIKLAIGIPNPTTIGGADAWYDPFIRVPDSIAGAVAAWDYQNYQVRPKTKFVELLQDVVADNPNVVVLSLMKQDEGIVVCRIRVSQSPISVA
jgi:hypothetical protein